MDILDTLIDQHAAVLMDAMGVLIGKDGAIPDAPAFVARLNKLGKRSFVLTNICGDTEEGIFDRLRRAGIPLLNPDQVISAGSLVARFLTDEVPVKATVAFIGPAACKDVIAGGGHQVAAGAELDRFDILAVLDDEGFPFRETLEAALSACVRSYTETGKLPAILLANSDCAYPAGPGRIAFGSGIFPVMLGEALKKMIGVGPKVISFGKPGARMFQEARRRAGPGSLMMIGDQIATDIVGANRAGMTSVLVETGLNAHARATGTDAQPMHVVETLRLGTMPVPLRAELPEQITVP